MFSAILPSLLSAFHNLSYAPKLPCYVTGILPMDKKPPKGCYFANSMNSQQAMKMTQGPDSQSPAINMRQGCFSFSHLYVNLLVSHLSQ